MNNIVLIGPNYVYREDVEGGKLIGFSCKIYWPGCYDYFFIYSFLCDCVCVYIASLKINFVCFSKNYQ